MRLYLGQWEWVNLGGTDAWQAPGGDARGLLDLRSLTAQAKAGGVPEGYGIFVYDGPRVNPLLLHDLGDAPDALLPATAARALNTLLGVTLTRDSLRNMLRQALLDPAAYDVNGAVRWKPLRCSSQRKCRLSLQPWGLMFDEPVDESHPATASSLAVYGVDYKRMRDYAETLSATSRTRIVEALKRYTGSTMKKLYRRMDDALAESILPTAYRLDGWTPPQTTFTETWPTDSTTLSSGQDQPWTEQTGTEIVGAAVVSGALRSSTASPSLCFATCDTNLSSDDHSHEASFTLGTDSNSAWAMVRASLAGSGEPPVTGYAMQLFRETGFHARRLTKSVNGTITILASDTTDPGASGTVQCQANGSDISGFDDASTFGPITDTAITGTLQIGARVGAEVTLANATLDNHTAADGGATYPGWFVNSRGGWW